MGNGLLNLLVALAIGLLIGLGRERSKGTGPRRGPAGVRTFAVTAILGALAMQLGGSLLVAVVTATVGALAAVAYGRRSNVDPGLTTEVALLLTPLLGALAITDRLTAAMLGIIVAVLLAAKPAIHRFARNTLTDREIGDGLMLAIVAVVVWPLLPDRAMGPQSAINPHLLGLVAVLVLAIGTVGHIAVRTLGPRFGLAVSGLASGFVSSVATIGAMGARARAEPATLDAAVAGAMLSSVATFVQMAVVIAAVSVETLRELALPLLAGSSVIAAFGAFYSWRASHVAITADATISRSVNLMTALMVVAAMTAILILTAVVQPLFGEAGLTLSAALGGIVDTHAAAMAVAALVSADRVVATAAVVPVLAAMTANAVMKITVAAGAGGRVFSLRIAAGVGLSMLAAWIAAWIVT